MAKRKVHDSHRAGGRMHAAPAASAAVATQKAIRIGVEQENKGIQPVTARNGVASEGDSTANAYEPEQCDYPPLAEDAWMNTIGMFDGDPIMREVLDASRAIRMAQRDR